MAQSLLCSAAHAIRGCCEGDQRDVFCVRVLWQCMSRDKEARRLRMADAPYLQPKYVPPAGFEFAPSFSVSSFSGSAR